MKGHQFITVAVFVFFFLIFRGLSLSQTVQSYDTGVAGNITGIYTNGSGPVYAVNDQGVVMHSHDGGKTWEVSQTYPGMSINALCGWTDMGTGNTNLFAVGNDGNYWYSKNGGAGWTQSTFPSSNDMNDIWGVSDPSNITNQYLWAVGNNSTIIFSHDGGTSWTEQATMYHYDDFHGVAFSDHQNGVIAGSTGILYNTTDSGNEWEYQVGDHSNPDYHDAWAVPSSTSGWVVGDGGTIIHTPDGGKTWIPQVSGTTENLNAVAFKDDGATGLTAGENGTLLETTDRGETWTPIDTNTDSDFFSVSSAAGTNSWVVGSSGKVLTVDRSTGSTVNYRPSALNYGCTLDGKNPKPQTVYISPDQPTTEWNLESNQRWVNVIPGSGTGNGYVGVYVDPTPLGPGHYDSEITLSSPGELPQTIDVGLDVLDPTNTDPPFGSFDTPSEGATVSGSVPVTGWALDDVGVDHVSIYDRDRNFLGDAAMVEGARPDIESSYPDYPNNQRAGWGFMLMTNFLPSGGNGTYTFHVEVTDIEGNTTTLGYRTVTCDNANAVKPFGAIDTPAQGGTVSGSNYVNGGWVLTPQPGQIPTDGSTINVFVDDNFVGHPAYNIYRQDIAACFPDYANSRGAVGYFSLDTTGYGNGVHTIQWTATDDAGNSDGIGRRYFTSRNTDVGAPGGNTNRVNAATSSSGLRKRKIETYDFHTDLTAPNPLIKSFQLINRGQQTLNWTAFADQAWVTVEPTSGTGEGWIFVTLDPIGLSSGEHEATVTIAEINNTSAPYDVDVRFNVLDETEPPFGEFTYPDEGRSVSGSIQLSGWALDDVGVESVAIYQANGDGRELLGNADFMRGGRPDVASAYSYLPDADRACWSYTLQTNAIEDGTYQFNAVVTDFEGNETLLEGHPFAVDNSVLTIPFVAIETPEEGRPYPFR